MFKKIIGMALIVLITSTAAQGAPLGRIFYASADGFMTVAHAQLLNSMVRESTDWRVKTAAALMGGSFAGLAVWKHLLVNQKHLFGRKVQGWQNKSDHQSCLTQISALSLIPSCAYIPLGVWLLMHSKNSTVLEPLIGLGCGALWHLSCCLGHAFFSFEYNLRYASAPQD